MKKTKRNIIISAILSLCLCVSLIAGATFAIFTSESKVNIAVTSGKVSVLATIPEKDLKLSSLKTIDGRADEDYTNDDRIYSTDNKFSLGGTATLNGNTLTLSNIMPGDKAEFLIVIHNDSNVNVQFRTMVKAENDNGLFAGLNFKICESENVAVSSWQTMAVGAEDIVYGCYVELPASAGNAYQDKACNLVFAVEAVQGNVKTKNDIHYPVNADGLKSSLEEGGTVYVTKDITTDETKTDANDRTIIRTPTTINLNATITVPGSLESSYNWAALYINADTTINAENGGITCLDKEGSDENNYDGGPYVAHVNVPGGTVTVNGGTYYGGCTTFNVQKGTLIVNGGFFKVCPYTGTKGYRYTLNCIDANYKDGTAKIIVKGGTFVNFDPSDNAAEGEGTNFVADGYAVIPEVKGEDIWYTVVKADEVRLTLEQFNALTKIPANVEQIYLDLGDTTVKYGETLTIGNDSMADSFAYIDKNGNAVKGNSVDIKYFASKELAEAAVIPEGYRVNCIRNMGGTAGENGGSSYTVILETAKKGINLVISGKVTVTDMPSLTEFTMGNGADIQFAVPGNSVVIADGLEIDGLYKIWTKRESSFISAVFPHKVPELVMKNCKLNGCWLTDGISFEKATFENCEFNTMAFKDVRNSNPMWWRMTTKSEVKFNGCTFTSILPVKFESPRVTPVLEITNCKFDISKSDIYHEDTRNYGVIFSTQDAEIKFGDVTLTGNQLLNETSGLVCFYNEKTSWIDGCHLIMNGNDVKEGGVVFMYKSGTAVTDKDYFEGNDFEK